MKQTWKKYLLYGSVVIGGGILFFILVETVRAKNTGFETKTLWDWMQLLIIPLVLAFGAFYLEGTERAVERKTAEDRSTLEREIATDRQQEVALQAYLDRMTDLLLKENLRTSTNEEVRNVARIRTLTVLPGLDARRKGLVFLFLNESGLIQRDTTTRSRGIITMARADLSNISLKGADLTGVDLGEANLRNTTLTDANLGGAFLVGAELESARLDRSNLQGADLREANLYKASLMLVNLTGANLAKAYLGKAYLFGACLEKAILRGVDLWEAYFDSASFEGADLYGAKVKEEQLLVAKSLRNATMPDGTKAKLLTHPTGTK